MNRAHENVRIAQMWEVREHLMFMTWMILCFAPKEKGIFSGERRELQPPNLWRPQESPLYIYKLLTLWRLPSFFKTQFCSLQIKKLIKSTSSAV